MEKNRRLTVVMFTDIVGYTALMQRDEGKAAAIRSRHREVFEQAHDRFHGNILQYFGDGSLSVFQSGVEAVACALQIQTQLREGLIVPLRIGLHLGDVVFDGTDIYGDGVNLASRIESLGVEGSILISAKLNDELKNQPQIQTQSLGKVALKNVAQPVAIFAVQHPGIVVPSKQDLKVKGVSDEKSVAVLPFVNRSGDSENEYFSDGLTEEIINTLAKIPNLRVTSRTSSFYFKNKNLPITQIGKALNVSTILEGSIRLSRNKIRITAQLIDVAADEHFWSEAFDRSLEDIFAVQDEISLLIADKLREQFGHLDIADSLVHKPTADLSAYEYMLKGKYYFNQWNPEDVNKGIEYFEQAVNRDGDLVDAWVGLADAYGFLATAGFAPREAAWMKVQEALQRAKALDPNHPGLNYQLANQAFFTEADFAKAARFNLKAIQQKPTYPEAQHYLSFLYMLKGEIQKAKEPLRYVQAIDPLNQETRFYQGYFLYRSGKYAEAVKHYELLLQDNPKSLPSTIVLIYALLKNGQYEEALDRLSHSGEVTIMPDEKLGLQCLAMAMKQGQADQKMLQELQSNAAADTSFQAHAYLFLVYAAMDQADQAFELLEKLFTHQSSILLLSFSDPLAEKLRDDPRYSDYHQKIYPPFEKEQQAKATKDDVLDPETIESYLERLEHCMEQERPYLNPTLTLRSLAGQLDIHPNHLSWLLNSKLGQNFNVYINRFRLEYFKKLVVDPSNSHISLVGLAYESGFNSKTVFNTFFKKEMGMTPRQYQKRSGE